MASRNRLKQQTAGRCSNCRWTGVRDRRHGRLRWRSQPQTWMCDGCYSRSVFNPTAAFHTSFYARPGRKYRNVWTHRIKRRVPTDTIGLHFAMCSLEDKLNGGSDWRSASPPTERRKRATSKFMRRKLRSTHLSG